MRLGIVSLVVCLVAVLPSAAQPLTKLRPETHQAFRDYTAEVERSWSPRMSGVEPFLKLWSDETARDRLLAGEVVTQRVSGYQTKVPDGYLHHWLSAAYVPGIRLAQVLAFLRDSDRHAEVYPEVISAVVIERRDDYQRVNKRMVKQKFFTMAVDTEGETHYDTLGPTRLMVRGYTLKSNEIVNMGKPDESLRPVGEGTGLFWDLTGYWWVEETADGVILELETLTLTRGIPVGVSWLLAPFLKTVPRQSMGAAMAFTRDAIVAYGEPAHVDRQQ